MRRISKLLCVILSLVLLVNIAGLDVAAGDIKDQQNGTQESTADTTEESTGEEAGDNSDNSSADQPDADLPEDDSQKDSSEDEKKDSVITEGNTNVTEETEDVAGSDKMLDTLDIKAANSVENIKAVPIENYTKLQVSWDAVENADSYKVSVWKKGSQESEAVFAKSDVKECTTTTDVLSAGTEYVVKVTAVKADNSEISGTIPAILLAKSSVKATAGDAYVKLTWSAVTGNSYYIVNNGSASKKVTTTALDYKGLKNGVTYSFSVQAAAELKDDSGKIYTYTSETVVVNARPMIAKAAQVTGVSAMDADKSAVLNWSKAARASSYVIYRYSSSKKKWVAVKTNVTKTSYTDTKLKAGQKYKYRIAAANASGVGPASSTVSVSIKKTPGTKVRTIGYKAVVKSRAPLFTSSKSKKRVKYLKAGTRVTTTNYGRGRYQLKLSNGKTYWISKDRLRFTSSIWTTKDYSSKVKTDFVNKKGYSSPTKYLIWINQYTQRVTIYEGKKGKWKINRSVKCATGTHLHMTPKGKFKITYKEKGWFYRSTYEKPIVHFQSQNSFHSRIKFYKGGYADATIGRPKSKGCVRLYDADINFIYKKCPKGTTVISH